MKLRLILPLLGAALLLSSCGDGSSPEESDKSPKPPGINKPAPEVPEGAPEPGVPQVSADKTRSPVAGSKRVVNPYPDPQNAEEEVKASFAKVIEALRDKDVKQFCSLIVMPRDLGGTCQQNAKYLLPKVSKKNQAALAASYNLSLERIVKAKVEINGDQALIIFKGQGVGSKIKVFKKNGVWKPAWAG